MDKIINKRTEGAPTLGCGAAKVSHFNHEGPSDSRLNNGERESIDGRRLNPSDDNGVLKGAAYRRAGPFLALRLRPKKKDRLNPD